VTRRPERLLIFTGHGKGKTTAALGMALRAAGHDMGVLIVQFVKSDSSTGEIAALGRMPGVEIVQCGCGFLPRELGADTSKHREAANRALTLAREGLASGRYGLVILDEVLIAVSACLLTASDVAAALSESAPGVCAVLTGRNAPQQLIEMADTVTEMRCLKHGYQMGIAAQQGVEF
jgi:cob(I)alamin adenosyltransferase